jgi:lipid-A-disaccharide synthase
MFSHMLCLLPFEPRYFEAVGLPATFVGHPVAYPRQADGAGFRAKHNIAPDAPMVCIMAGSRKGEILKHIEIFAQTINRLGAVYPNIAMVVPVSQSLLTVVAPYFDGCPYRCVIVTEEQEKWDAVAASDVGLIKSGTVSLEVARLGLPQVVTYKTSWLSAFIIRKKIRIKYVNLINILLGREVIPELLQERCKPEYLMNALEAMLMHRDLARRQQAQVAEAFEALLPPRDTPQSLAANAVLKVIT